MPALRTRGAIRLLGVLAAGGWVTVDARENYVIHSPADPTGRGTNMYERAAIIGCARRRQIAADGSGALTITALGRADWARVQATAQARKQRICRYCEGNGLIVVGWDPDAYENIEGPCPACQEQP